MELTWEQKMAALNALSPCSLIMRKPGDWYVQQDTDIKDKSILRGEYGNGETPEEAVNDHWGRLTTITPPLYIVARASRDDRKAVRWNGFMWDSVREEVS